MSAILGMMTHISENKAVDRSGKKRPRKITESYLHNAGLFYLQRYSSSVSHFRQVMKRKIDRSCRFHTDQDSQNCLRMLDELIEKFCQAGLLNDETYARAQVSSLRRRGYGARAVISRLASKGLSRDIVESALAREESDYGQDERKAALNFARRRRIGPFRAKAPADSEEAKKIRNREMASMGRAGFGYDVASRVLGMDRRQADELLEIGSG